MYSKNISRSKIVLNPLHSYRAFIPKLRYATHGDFPHGGVKAAQAAAERTDTPVVGGEQKVQQSVTLQIRY